MARNIITGIDAGTSTIKVLVGEKRKDSRGLNVLGAGKKISTGIRRGYIANFEEAVKSIRSAIKEAEKTAGVPIKQAYLAIGGIGLGSIKSKGSVMISKADGEITEYDIKRAISQSETNLSNIVNRKIIHSFPLVFKVDNQIIEGNPLGMRGTKLEVEMLFITALNQHLNDLIKAVESCGVVVEDVVASPLAASYAVLTEQQKEVGCVLANIGAGTVSIIVFEEGKPISLEVFPIGSIHITNDIALGFQVPLEEAERLKLEYGSEEIVSKRKLSDIIEARLNDIFELIEAHLKKINRQGLLPAGIILTGGGSNLVSLEEIAKASLRLPAKSSVAFKNHGKIMVSKNIKEEIINNPEWSVSIGLCLMGTQEDIDSGIKIKKPSKLLNPLKKYLRFFLP